MSKLKAQLVKTAFICAVSLTGCSVNQERDHFQGINDLMRPAVVLQYEFPLQSATNNVESFKDAIALSPFGYLNANQRQVVVVSNIGEGGDVIAMERAKKGALLAIKAGEVNPRLYVRKAVSTWQSDKLEVFVVPQTVWNDQAFLAAMTNESLLVQPLGGVIKAEVARWSLDQVLERRLVIPAGNLKVNLKNTLQSVGWTLEAYGIPASETESVTIAVSLGESGKATPTEATEIARTIINLTSTPNLDIRTDIRRKVVEVYGDTTI